MAPSEPRCIKLSAIVVGEANTAFPNLGLGAIVSITSHAPAKDANSWENERNPLDPNAYIWHQLEKKPCEINAAPGTHAPQQTTSTDCNDLLDHLVGARA